jgi:hypothetical protein
MNEASIQHVTKRLCLLLVSVRYYQSKKAINSTTDAFDIPIDTNLPPIEECSIPEVQALVSSAMALIRIITSVSSKRTHIVSFPSLEMHCAHHHIIVYFFFQ